MRFPQFAPVTQVVLTACGVALAAACSTGLSGPGPDDTVELSPDTTQSVAIVRDVSSGWPADAVSITAASFAGDTLLLSLTHGGGCREHRFRLLVGNAWMESFPVAVGAKLAHDAHGDGCKALITRSLRVSLAPLRDAYLRVYGSTADRRIRLSLAGAPVTLIYQF